MFESNQMIQIHTDTYRDKQRRKMQDTRRKIQDARYIKDKHRYV